MLSTSPLVLVVLDGWGFRSQIDHNPIAAARKPFFDLILKQNPHTLLAASGLSVGLPAGQMGNSEVGHMTIGAGRTIDTDIVRIDKAIENGAFDRNESFQKLFEHVKKHDSTLHIKGLVSPGGVHSHQRHLYAFLKLAKARGIKKIAIHAFTDGRDTPPQSAAHYLKELEKILENVGIGRIATISGRYYAMDRDHNWDRVDQVGQAIFDGQSATVPATHGTPSRILEQLYASGQTDEHIKPLVILDQHGQAATLGANDGVFLFNFRADRARMISRRVREQADAKNIFFVTLTRYDTDLSHAVAFPPPAVTVTLAGEIAKAGLTQVHIAETEKYAHATYFLNVGREAPYSGERDVMIKSRSDIRTHDEAPEMRAAELTTQAIAECEAGVDFMFINYANADMVGHTANYAATIKAVESIDRELSRLAAAINKKGGTLFITADHGNAEISYDQEVKSKHTAHTSNPVPGILIGSRFSLRDQGSLADVAPTMLTLLGLPVPPEMTGKSLLTNR